MSRLSVVGAVMARIINLPREWLKERTSLEKEVERCRELPDSARETLIHLMTEFASEMDSTDELWRFSSPPESWKRMCGSAGMAIVRNGDIVAAYQLIMN